MKTIKLLALLIISSLVFTSCSNDDDHGDDDDHDHENEVFTTVIYTLTDEDGDTITLTYTDLDPEDTVDGTYEVSGSLTANTEYTGEITVLNETDDEPEHLQEEIEAEADEHEFFFSSTVDGIEFEKTDEDSSGNPVGFETILTTGACLLYTSPSPRDA